jgi:hypothetical protein
VKAWIDQAKETNLFVSVVTILEIEICARQMERRDNVQGRALLAWLEEQVLPFFERRIVPVDLEIARRVASLHVPNPRPYRDSLIAATALIHSMTVVTRNTTDFVAMKATVFNPWRD